MQVDGVVFMAKYYVKHHIDIIGDSESNHLLLIYLGKKECGYYVAGGNHKNEAYVYNTGNDYSGQHGMHRINKSGCIFDIYLDLTNYTINFKTSGQDTGVTIRNLPKEDYRMIVSMYNEQQIEFVAFDYH